MWINQQVMSMVSSSSLSSRLKYDVFLSFRGEDTRRTITSHLFAGLRDVKIDTYMDDEKLVRGEEIESALMKAIEKSKISIIIFSEDYAGSRWCLGELVHILKCRETYGQIVVPVFHNIDPSQVRASAFNEDRFKKHMNKVPIWRDAVLTAANLSGFHSKNFGSDAELVKTIVKDILEKLSNQRSTDLKGLVGIKSRIQQIESLLFIEAQNVPFLIVGIWGKGGIGKTTLADAVFQGLSSRFESCSFLANIRDESEKRGINDLRNRLLSDILKGESMTIGSPSIGLNVVLDRLSRTKVLVVLDDVSETNQLDHLLNGLVFDRGSRIIITSRNRRTLMDMGRVDADHIYEVKELDFEHAHNLFCSKAFKDGSSKIEYSDLSRRAVEYANCVPLALNVLGSSFRQHCTCRKDWEDLLMKLKEFPDPKIENVLRVSYNGLEEHDKGVFLDITCFLKGKKKSKAERVLEMHGYYARQGIPTLVDMSLISVSVDDRLEIHDLIQEMGRSIVYEQCKHNPGKRSRLWKAEDVRQVLTNETGTTRVEAIISDLSKIKMDLSRTALKNLLNLRLLELYAPNLDNRVCLPEGLQSFPESLRYLYWESYPLKYLPSKFSPHNLVELHMPGGEVKKLWKNDGQNLGSLKVINLSFCINLREFPNLSRSPKIERINLSGCERLVQVPSYVKDFDKLFSMKLANCSSLATLPKMPSSLRILDASSCNQLSTVPDLSHCQNIEEIDLGDCEQLVQIPSYIKNLDNLITLKLAKCSSLKTFPEIPNGMRFIDLSSCDQLFKVPDLSSCSELEKVDLSDCERLGQVPSFVKNLKLTKLNLANCSSLKTFPEIPPSMRFIDLSNSNQLSKVPDLSRCSDLETVDLSDCGRLGQVPSFVNNLKLTKLNMANCSSLKNFPEIPHSMRFIDLSNSNHLSKVPDLSRCSDLEKVDLSDCERLSQVPSFVKNLKLTKLNLANCSSLRTFPEIPRSMRFIDLSNSNHLIKIPDLSHCSDLETVDLSDCGRLVQVPSFVNNLKLTKLNMANCRSLKTFPEIPRSMRFIDLSSSNYLTEFPDISHCSDIEKIDLCDCGILVQVPSYVKNLDKLTHLKLANCWSFKTFPELPRSLRVLNFSGCHQVTNVPDFSRCPDIEKIDLCGCKSLVQVPSCKILHRLTSLQLAQCSSLKTFPEIPCSLQILDFSSCNQVKKVPDFSQCPNIEKVVLSDCTSLLQVPSCKNLHKLTSLKLDRCSSLQTFPKLPSNIRVLNFSSCNRVSKAPDLSKCPNIEKLDLTGCASSVTNEPSYYYENLRKLTSTSLKL